MGNEIAVIHSSDVEDWSVLSALNFKIDEAKELISKSEGQLGEKYDSIVQTIAKIEDELKRREAQVPKVESKESELEAFEDLSNKQLFKKIAQFTHPDKLGDPELFKRAKKALKSKNREGLMGILNEVKANYAELIALKQKEYEDLITSNKYLLALDWFSGDFAKQSKAETFYLNVLMQNLQALQKRL